MYFEIFNNKNNYKLNKLKKKKINLIYEIKSYIE